MPRRPELRPCRKEILIVDLLLVVAVWLHTVAFVIGWGYYGILGRIVLPALGRSLDGPAQASALVAIERRALPLIVISLVLFTVTGTYLLVADPEYAGIGNVLASTWTVLMLVKHVLVVALVVLGVAVDRLGRRAGLATSAEVRAAAIHRLTLTAEGATALGALIVLLTAAAQAVA
jgi:uncharacterized membrane protein